MKVVSKLNEKLPVGIRKETNKLYKYLPRSKKTVTKQIDGIWYELELNTLVHSQIYHYGYWEKDVTGVIEKFVKKDMVCFDIGASSGPHTLRMAKCVGTNGQVHAFEPSTVLFPKLVKHILMNNFKNIYAQPYALSDKIEKKMYYNNTFVKIGKEEKEVDDSMTYFETIDNYVKEQNIKKVDFIKIDVDGYETKIITGGAKTIKTYKPIMVVEFAKKAQEKYGSSIEQIIHILEELEYHFYRSDTLMEYQNVLDAVPENGSINVVCKELL